MMRLILTIYCFIFSSLLFAQNDLILNADGRNTVNLNGKWRILIDPYESGYYNYRYTPTEDGFFLNRKPKDKGDLVEYDFDKADLLNVPGDWNTQMPELFFYEGTIWYKKSFDYTLKVGKRNYIYFGAVNYHSIIYLNGKKVGEHEGGFTPFNFDITDFIRDGENFVVLKVDNKRRREGVPTSMTDWWNYGGITRDVKLIEVDEVFVRDYSIQLDRKDLNTINGWIQLDGKINGGSKITIRIPEAGLQKEIQTDTKGYAAFKLNGKLNLWSPESPYLYDVFIFFNGDTLKDKIGFRQIAVKEEDILLNGNSVFLRGICMHEEAPYRTGRAFSEDDARTMLSWAKELGCNFVRLAHYPHNENIIKLADEMGLLVWEEIPVYWTILWENSSTYNLASAQLKEMIMRDKNRASVIIWSMANETPRGDARLKFLKSLIDEAKLLDNTRLITAATEVHYNENNMTLDDPLGEMLDVIGVNEYVGWYGGKPEDAPKKVWNSIYKKPLIISELGADAAFNYHADKETKFTEEYQAELYSQQIKMLKQISFLRGVSPWILMDFRSPRRLLPGIQDYFNRKGLISDQGQRKQAFYILQDYYKWLKHKN